MSASVSYVCLSMRELLDSAGGSIYVKLLGMIWSPGTSRYFPDMIATDPPFRRPALSPLFPPNSRIAAASLGGTPARPADAVEGESVGQWGHTRPRSAGHALLP